MEVGMDQMEVGAASDSDKKPSKVTILEDIQLGPASHLTIIKPAGAVLVQTELKEGKKINILQRRNQLLMASQKVEVSMNNSSQVLTMHTTGQLLPKHTERISELLKQKWATPSNTSQTVIASGSFTKVSNITSPKGQHVIANCSFTNNVLNITSPKDQPVIASGSFTKVLNINSTKDQPVIASGSFTDNVLNINSPMGQPVIASSSFTNDLNINSPKGQPVIASGSFTDVSNITSPKEIIEKPKEPRVPIIMRRPELEHGVKPEDVKIFSKHTGPEWYPQNNNMQTAPIISKNLPKAFHDFPLFGIPKNRADLPHFQDQLVQDFVGVSDEEYDKLKKFCSPDMLFTGNELKMSVPRPMTGTHSSMALRAQERVSVPEDNKLQTLKKLDTRIKLDINNLFSRKLKYRGVRLLSLQNQEKPPEPEELAPDLTPGHDTLFRVRLFRPFTFAKPGLRRRAGASDGQQFRGRHSVFNCDVMLLGRQTLSALRDRIVCRNDLDLRLDLSEHPHLCAPANSKDSFPSNFMFINNVFYTDTRPNCKDLTREVRDFAEERGIGRFEVRDMCTTTLGEIHVRLAYPEVYVHQGDCEHLFQFSEIRLLNYSDPLHLSNYPCHTAAPQNQTLYCSTCAEFAAKWIVTNTESVPFDPAFFCDTCFFSYMYVDGKKVDNFKAYLYKGNEMNVLRPFVDFGAEVASRNAQVPLNEVRINY